jgi:hypothetical protein
MQIYKTMYLRVHRVHGVLHGGWDTDSLICPLDSQTQQNLDRNNLEKIKT